jgi:hypothetical protein
MILPGGLSDRRLCLALLLPALAGCSVLLDTDSLVENGAQSGTTSTGNTTSLAGASSETGGRSSAGGTSESGGAGAISSAGGSMIQGAAGMASGGATSACSYYPDADGDGYGDGQQPAVCEPKTGYVDNDSDCDDTNPLVHPKAKEYCDGIDNDCSPSTPDDCVKGCRGLLSDRAYMVCNVELSWPDSRAACLAEKMTLVQIDDSQENSALQGMMGSIQSIWTGGTDVGSPGTWSWPDGTVYFSANARLAGVYSNWYMGEPDNLQTEQCQEFWQDGTWGSYVCDDPNWGYICERR